MGGPEDGTDQQGELVFVVVGPGRRGSLVLVGLVGHRQQPGGALLAAHVGAGPVFKHGHAPLADLGYAEDRMAFGGDQRLAALLGVFKDIGRRQHREGHAACDVVRRPASPGNVGDDLAAPRDGQFLRDGGAVGRFHQHEPAPALYLFENLLPIRLGEVLPRLARQNQHLPVARLFPEAL